VVTQTRQRTAGQPCGISTIPQGQPIECPYAVHEERLNGVLRDRLNCLTRKTHAFAKREQTWDAAVVLCLFESNWLRSHPALPCGIGTIPQGLREPANDLPNGCRLPT
jgi:hypothetical protein